MSEWQPIETAPVGVRLLLWWRPIDGNKHAETSLIGQVCYGEYEGQWWNDQRGAYQDLWHITHWKLLPEPPEDKS
ncbi:MAG: DUF551 domain-containing protein [Bacteroidales bacterium]|nr:DUF551 domain-containing protein [Candidatus Latescibacterota bacterium]